MIPGVTVSVSDTRIPVSFVSRVPVSGDLALHLACHMAAILPALISFFYLQLLSLPYPYLAVTPQEFIDATKLLKMLKTQLMILKTLENGLVALVNIGEAHEEVFGTLKEW